jgi:HSP20 family molecular chaperone IbpA
MFNKNSLLGFDYLEKMMDDLAKSNDNYPPYNIEKIGERKIRITIAVAGFCEDDLDVNLEGNKLIISGCQNGECEGEMEEREFVYRGIASRKFRRTFLIDKSMKILRANLENGLLHIDMEKPEMKKEVKSIKIESGGKNKKVKKITKS